MSIYFVGGSKGGVGKSLVSMALVNHFISNKILPALIETDTNNPDVYKMYREHSLPVCKIYNLDNADGWISLVDKIESIKDTPIIVNTAARSNDGVKKHGSILLQALPELGKKFTTLWVINRQRDSLELLKEYIGVFSPSIHKTHVLKNTYFGDASKFELYGTSNLKSELESHSCLNFDFPDLADRVSDALYSNRFPIDKALTELPLGSRAELSRWVNSCSEIFKKITNI